MKLAITTNPKQVEVANMLLARAIESIKANPQLQKEWKLTLTEIEEAAKFREQLLDSFLKA